MASNNAPNNPVVIGADELQKIISGAFAAAIREARNPTPTESEIAAVEQAQQYRKEQSQQVRAALAQKKSFQQVCSHEHSRREGGGTHCVWVHDNDIPGSSGYIYCQRCEGRIRPESEQMRKLDPQATFSTALFNKLFQDCSESAMMGG